MNRPIIPGTRVRHRTDRTVGVVLARAGQHARVAEEGRLPREVPVEQLERVR